MTGCVEIRNIFLDSDAPACLEEQRSAKSRSQEFRNGIWKTSHERALRLKYILGAGHETALAISRTGDLRQRLEEADT